MAMAAVEFLINTAVALRYLSTTVLAVLRAILPSLLLAVTMFLALYITEPLLSLLIVPARLVFAIMIGAATYLCGAWIFRLSAFTDGVKLLREILQKR